MVVFSFCPKLLLQDWEKKGNLLTVNCAYWCIGKSFVFLNSAAAQHWLFYCLAHSLRPCWNHFGINIQFCDSLPLLIFKRLWETTALLCLIKVNGGLFPFEKALSVVRNHGVTAQVDCPTGSKSFHEVMGASRKYFSCDSSSNNNNDHTG